MGRGGAVIRICVKDFGEFDAWLRWFDRGAVDRPFDFVLHGLDQADLVFDLARPVVCWLLCSMYCSSRQLRLDQTL